MEKAFHSILKDGNNATEKREGTKVERNASGANIKSYGCIPNIWGMWCCEVVSSGFRHLPGVSTSQASPFQFRIHNISFLTLTEDACRDADQATFYLTY